jgi:tRNA-Thr(GGU) m(6)t(6)A37 methyltransferase TsaA
MGPIRDYDLPEHFELAVRPVAVMRSPFKVHVGTPRQPGAGERRGGAIVVRHGLQNLLRDLGGFSHVWVVFWCNHARGWNDLVVPPRDRQKRGLFATRAPHRPNPIGISVLELLRIERRVLHVGAHDLLDGTPILDIKPYLAYCDSVPGARGGWVDALGDAAGPDHRDWRRPAAAPAAPARDARGG